LLIVRMRCESMRGLAAMISPVRGSAKWPPFEKPRSSRLTQRTYE
jgi:hypothetical protein